MLTRKLLLMGLFFVAAPAVLGQQMEPHTITITASSNQYVAPDQVVFSVSLTTPINVTLDQVVATLAPLGITAADLQSASTPYDGGVFLPGGSLPGPSIVWTFTLPAPIASLSGTLKALLAFQANNSALQYFSIVGTQVSAQAAAAQVCPLSSLLTDAQAQAQKVAATANLTVGPVLALSNSSSANVPPLYTPVLATISFVPLSSQGVSSPCSLVVKFGLVP
jgi:uncharacterized protein YggE